MLNFCGLRDLVKVVFLNLFKKKREKRICDVVEVYVCLMIKFWLNFKVDILNWLYLGLSSFYDNEMWVIICKI